MPADPNTNKLDYAGLQRYHGKIQQQLTQQSQQIQELGNTKADKTAQAVVDAAQDDRLKILEAFAEGKLFLTETDSTEAYSKLIKSNVIPEANKALIQSIGGKSLVMNQLVQNGNFASDVKWSIENGISYSVNNNVATIQSSTEGDPYLYQSSINLVASHKYIVFVDGYRENASSLGELGGGMVFFFGSYSNAIRQTFSTTRTKYAIISVAPNVITNVDLRFYSKGNTTHISNVMLIDLTQMFGSGREPQSVEEFKAQFPLDYYEYNLGEIISADCDSIVSKDSEQTTLGTLTVPQALRTAHPLRSAGNVHDEYNVSRKFTLSNMFEFHLDGTETVVDVRKYTVTKRLGFTIGLPTPKSNGRYFISNKDIACIYDNRDDEHFYINGDFLQIFIPIEMTYQEWVGDGVDFVVMLETPIYYYDPASHELAVNGGTVVPDDTHIVDPESYFPASNHLPVESGGTVTFEQEDTEFPVPNTISYLRKVVTA